MRAAVSLLLLLAVAGAPTSRGFRLPWQHQDDKTGNHTGPHEHHGHQPHKPFEPRYTVVHKQPGFEERRYNATSFATIKYQAWSWDFSLRGAVGKLMRYAHGFNKADKHFPPSVPLLTRFVSSNNTDDFSRTEKTFETSIYLPKKPGSNATLPVPLNKAIHVRSYPPLTIFAHRFPGYAFSWTLRHEAFHLFQALKSHNVTFKGGIFLGALYDPPSRIFHRRNEVWFALKPGNTTEVSLFDGMDAIMSPALEAGLAQEAMKTV